jgi:Zn-dependent peptidase ImmA (M78 family)/DNA-binding XRE family transcriptional regulator
MIGNRIKMARLAAGLTLDEVSERLNKTITKAALSKYENNRSVPSPSLLVKLAGILNQKAVFFFEEDEPHIEWMAYRKHKSLPKRFQKRIQAFASIRVEWYFRLWSLLKQDLMPTLPKPVPVNDFEKAEKLASSLRKEWELGNSPIGSISQLVEDHGVAIFEWNSSNGFDGLSAIVNDSYPVIVVCMLVSTDRIRFNICHELGHLLMDCSSVEPDEEEKIAHRFASAFLIPRDTMLHELGAKRRHLTLNELALLKEKYGISMQALIRRAYDLDIISKYHYKGLNITFVKRGWKRNEPVDYKGHESPYRFSQMFARAVAEGIVSREKAMRIYPKITKILDLTVEKEEPSAIRQLMRLPIEERRKILESTDAKAIAFLNKDTELKDFEVLDGENYAEEG